ncbi:hypothetical protein [Cryptosporangium japonicum]|uniref:Integral membrane protein n=1 Tax=Cryptosporangium japonicum TaxID=80872 RepID=A0ABN0UYB7_9ACTN
MGTCLRTDAAYCAVAALLLGLFAEPVGGALGVPAGVPLTAAVLTLGWAGMLLALAARRRPRGPVRFVLVANVVAVAGLAALASTRPLDALSLLLLAVAVEVGAFAVWQAVLLRTRRG